MLLTKYFQCDQLTKVKSSGACGMCGGENKCLPRLGGGTETKRPLEGSRRRWWHNIEKYLQWIDVDRIYLSYDRDVRKALVNVVMNIWFS